MAKKVDKGDPNETILPAELEQALKTLESDMRNKQPADWENSSDETAVILGVQMLLAAAEDYDIDDVEFKISAMMGVCARIARWALDRVDAPPDARRKAANAYIVLHSMD